MGVRHTLVKKFGFGNFFTNHVTILVNLLSSWKIWFNLYILKKIMPDRHFVKLQL